MENFIICNNEKEINENCSCWGNDFYTISKEDIEALLHGKTLHVMVNDEYGVFINMEETENALRDKLIEVLKGENV